MPAASLFDWLEGGATLEEFLDNFPSVTRDQAIAALEEAKARVIGSARHTDENLGYAAARNPIRRIDIRLPGPQPSNGSFTPRNRLRYRSRDASRSAARKCSDTCGSCHHPAVVRDRRDVEERSRAQLGDRPSANAAVAHPESTIPTCSIGQSAARARVRHPSTSASPARTSHGRL